MNRTRIRLAALTLALVMLLGMAPAAQAIMMDPTDTVCMYGGDHQWMDWVTDPEPGCITEGRKTRYCGVCQYQQTETIPALGHDFRDDWSVMNEPGCETDGMAIRFCHRCQQEETRSIPALGHDWDGGKVTKETSCRENGIITYTCNRCGATKTEYIPLGPHEWELRYTEAPTCTEGGFELYGCKHCNADKTVDLGPLGHDWDGGKVTKEPTVDAEGVRTYTCKRDPSHTKTESIPKLNPPPPTNPPPTNPPPVTDPPTHEHKWGDWFVEEKGTCVKKALLRRVCSCGAEEYKYGDYGDHVWGEWHTVKEPTYTQPGTEERICKIESSHREEREIPPTGGGANAVSIRVVEEGSGKDLPGAYVQLRNGAGAVIDEWISSGAAHIIEGLEDGTYTVEETSAPEGYSAPAAFSFTVGETVSSTGPIGQSGDLLLINSKKPVKAELTIFLEAQDYDTEVPKTEFREGESVWFYGYVVNTGTVDLELRDCVMDISGVWHWNGATEDTQDGIVLKPGEKYEGNAYWFISTNYKPVSAADVAPGTETAELYGTITYSVQVPGYKPGTDEVLCTAAASSTIGVLKDENALKPSLLFADSWAADAGVGKRYVGAVVNVDHTLTNTGNCDLYLPGMDGLGDSIDAPHPKGDGELSDCYRLAPGESLTVHNYHRYVKESDVEKGALYRNGLSSSYGAYYMNENGKRKFIYSNSFEENIPLTYPDGTTPEEKKPQLTLTFLYDDPAKEVYDPDDEAWACFSLANTGNVPLKAVAHFTSDGVVECDYDEFFFKPGGSVTEEGWGWSKIQKGITPGTETEDLLGTVTIHFYYKGLDPDTGEELCRTQTITRTWKVAKPGPKPWPIPEESGITVTVQVSPGYESSDPAGYQLGEKYGLDTTITNTGKVAIPAHGITRYDPYDGYTDTKFPTAFMPGETVGCNPGGWNKGTITEEDVARGYIYFPPVQHTWTDPDSGNEKTAYSNDLTLKVISKTGLVLEKQLRTAPGPLGYFQAGDKLEWRLTIKNNSNEPVRNVVVTDQGETVGTFAEIAPGEEYIINPTPYTVTEYDVGVGEVSNYFTVTGTDLQGAEHTWTSAPVTAPCNKFSPVPPPVPPTFPEKGETEEPKEDPGDPMGPIHELKVGAAVRKEEDGGPLNGSYYELDEEVKFVIFVKNTGEVPLENVTVYDSLNGFVPIGTAASIAPNAEVPFNFSHKVTQPDIDGIWIINSASVTYEFDGGKPGTPQKSNEVKVKAGDKENNTTGGGGHVDPLPPPTTPGGDPLVPVTTPDGTPVTTPDGTPIVAPPGTVPVLDPDGVVVTTPDGDPILMLPDGTYFIVGPDGTIIKTDKDGNPLYDGSKPDFNGKTRSCELRLNSLGDSEADYTLHACSEHAGAAKDAEAAGLAGNWAGAAEIWRGEVEKLYEKFYEAADDEGKAALVQERAAFLAYADAWKALAGDEAAAETLRFKCAEMCCILHTLPAELPGSIVGSHREVINGEACDVSAREIGALKGADSKVTERYAGGEARALKDVRAMLAEAKTHSYDEVFYRGQRAWQIALDAAANTAYKNADRETRKKIIAWRTALDTLYAAEQPLLELIYPSGNATVQETLMNLYKDAAFDALKLK